MDELQKNYEFAVELKEKFNKGNATACIRELINAETDSNRNVYVMTAIQHELEIDPERCHPHRQISWYDNIAENIRQAIREVISKIEAEMVDAENELEYGNEDGEYDD